MKLTARQLHSFNRSLKEKFWISFNEYVNKQRGLPPPEVREQLRILVTHNSGLMNEPLNLRDVKKGVDDGVIKF